MIEGYVQGKYGFKVHTAYITEVKRDFNLTSLSIIEIVSLKKIS